MPRGGIRWTLPGGWQTSLFATYSRSAYRLPLDLLAVGDPAAPTAEIFRWTNTATPLTAATVLGPVIARVGPGTGGDVTFSRIDNQLRRPIADEVILGIDVQPTDALLMRIAGTVRRERDLLRISDVGAPASAYSSFPIADTGPDVFTSADDRDVPVYARLPATFGADRYLLENRSDGDASVRGVEVSARLTTPRVILFAGATASIARAPAASLGYGPLENDQSIVSDLFVTPNRETFERGRPFNDRAYTMKVAAIGRLPGQVHVGIVARYQDGQPFARVVVAPDLPQGAEAVRAFPNGDLRFVYIGTLDARLQKRVEFNGWAVSALVDGYNLAKLSNGVEERAAAAPNVRIPTAVQPPRVFQAGFAVTF
jgi:hypothetical protein